MSSDASGPAKPLLLVGRRAGLILLGASLLAGRARAQGEAEGWPSRPVRVVAPFAPGGSADTLGRLVTKEVSAALGQPFVVDNRPGAGGLLGSAMVAQLPPDGANFVISGIASHVIAPAINAKPGFDPIQGFTHIAYLGGPPTVLVVGQNSPVRDLAGFLRKARSERSVTFGTPGVGTHGHLIGELFRKASGIGMEHVPYRGAGNSLTDLLSGATDCGFITLGSAAGPVRQGQLRALAVTTADRLRSFAELPTFREQGFPDLVATTWFGLSGPAHLPTPVVERLNAAVLKALAAPVVRERLDMDGTLAVAMTAPEFTRFVAEETARWAPIARASGASVQ